MPSIMRTLITSLFLVFLSLVSFAQVTVQIGTGTDIPANTLYSPVYRFSSTSTTDNATSNILFTQAELSAAGITAGATINKLAFNKVGPGGITANGAVLEFYMTNSSRTTLLNTGSRTTTWDDIQATHTQVFADPDYKLASGAGSEGWIEYTITPFVYTGGAIEIASFFSVDAITSPKTTDEIPWEYTSSVSTEMIIGRTGSTPAAVQGTNALNSTVAGYLHRPNIQITFSTTPGTDLAITSIDNPTAPVCPGTESVDIEIASFNTGIITSATIDWTVNGVLQTPFNYVGVLALGSTANVNLGNITLAAATNYDIEVFLSAVNGSAGDDNVLNDTASLTGLQTSLSGAYTIDGGAATAGTNFNSFSDFAAALAANDICGPVVVDVATGTYTEQVSFPNLSGSSATNTITVRSATGNAINVTLNFPSATGSADNYALDINGTDYITFEDMTISRTGANTYASVITFQNDADNVTFDGCFIQGIALNTTSTNSALVYSSVTADAQNCDNLSFTSNSFSNGSSALYTLSATVHAVGGTFTDNVVSGYYYYGMYIEDRDDVVISNNNVTSAATTSTTNYGLYINDLDGTSSATSNVVNGNDSYGIYLNDLDESFLCDGNTVNNTNIMDRGIYLNGSSSTTGGNDVIVRNNVINGAQYGIYIDFSDRGASNPFQIYNNMINISYAGTGANAGIYTTGSDYVNLDFNSIYIEGGNTSTSTLQGAIVTTGTVADGSINIRNNVMFNNGNSADDFTLSVGTTVDIATLSNNAYYAPNATNIAYWGADQADFATFTGNSGETGAVNADPQFTSTTDLHAAALQLFQAGTTLAGITTDIDGDLRGTPPNIGADEFTISVSCLFPSTINVSGITATTADVDWVKGSAVPSDLEFGPSGFTQGAGTLVTGISGNTYNITGLTANTAYDVYVRDSCGPGNSSIWVGPVGFTTSCLNLSGTYTIGGTTPDFATIQDAVNALCGVSGPVTFNIRTGTYTEQVSIPAVPGASLTNTITFQAETGTNTDVVWTYPSSASIANNYTVELNEADFITFQNLTMERRLDSTYARVITMLDGAENISFDNVIFNSDRIGVSSTNNAFIYGSETTDALDFDNFSCTNSTFNNGSYGIYLLNATGPHALNGNVSGNTFNNIYTYAIYLEDMDNVTVQNNTITGASPASTSFSGIYLNDNDGTNLVDNNTITGGDGYGIYMTDLDDGVTVSNNTITDVDILNYGIYMTGSVVTGAEEISIFNNQIISDQYGIYLTTSDGSTTNYGKVYNNMISIDYTGTGTNGGIYCTGAENWDFTYNSIYVDGSSSSTSANQGPLVVTGTIAAATINIQNNSLFNNMSGTDAFALSVTDGDNVGVITTNNYYAPNATNLGYWEAADRTTFADLTTASGETGALNEDPVFLTPGSDLHAASTLLLGAGTNIGTITTDIDGDSRAIPPCIGADEYTISCAPPTSVTVTGITTTAADVNWVKGSAAPTDLEYGPAGFTQGSGTAVTGLTVSTYNISGLTDNTDYEVYVRDSCAAGNTSVWIGPIAFTTSCLPLSGTYTIGGTTPDYATIQDAVDALCGVSAPVVFNIRTGTYNEQVNITAVPGASSTNTITFQAETGVNTDVVWETPTSAGSADNYLVQLDGADFIILQNMTLGRVGTDTYARVVSLTNGAENITLNNLIIENDLIGVSSTNNALVYGSETLDANDFDNFTATNNTFNNSSYGIYLLNATAPHAIGGTVTGNTFNNVFTYGAYLEDMDDVTMSNNTVNGALPASTSFRGLYLSDNDGTVILDNNIISGDDGYGIYMTDLDDGVTVSNNTITDVDIMTYGIYITGSVVGTTENLDFFNNQVVADQYGLYITTTDATSTLPGKVYNNMFSIDYAGGTASCNGIYLDGDNFDLQFNSVFIQGNGTGTLQGGIYMSTSVATASTNIQNNTLYNDNSGADGYAIYVASVGDVSTISNNNYYAPNSSNFAYWGADMADFATFTGTSGEVGAINENPFYTSATDLHAANPLLSGAGTSIAGITTDIDGDVRSTPPCIGADEFAPTAIVFPPTSLTANATSSTDIGLTWGQNTANDDVILVWDPAGTFGGPVGGNTYNVGDVLPGGGTVLYVGSATSYTHSGLTPQTQYFYAAWSVNGTSYSPSNVTADATTPCPALPIPFSESFDGAASWTSGTGGDNLGDAIDGCWTRSPDPSASNYFWGTRVGTTTTSGTGPDDDVKGGGNYIFVESSNGSTGSQAFFTSPLIDLSGVTGARLRFSYHMYGPTSGTIAVEANGGSGWSQVFSVSGQQQTSGTAAWSQQIVDVSAYAGGNIQIRFVATRGTSFTGDMAIDEISVAELVGPTAPLSFTATGSSASQIDLAATANTSGDDILVAWGTNNTFGAPLGTYVAGDTVLGGGRVLYVGPAAGLVNHTGLPQGTQYYYEAWSYDGISTYSLPATANATTLTVNPPLAFDAAAISGSQIDITFTPNVASNNVVIVSNATGTFTPPVDGTPSPTVGASFAGGTVLYVGTASPFNHTGLTANTQYFYSAYSVDGSDYYSTDVTDAATTLLNCPALSPLTLPFTEDFESASGTQLGDAGLYCNTNVSVNFETSQQASGQIDFGTNAGANNGGAGAAVLYKNGTGTDPENYLILTMDLSAYTASTNLLLSYDVFNAWDEVDAADKVWVRGSSSDPWLQIDDWQTSGTQGVWVTVSGLDIDAILTAGSQAPSATFGIRFGQDDNSAYLGSSSGDGAIFDNITIFDGVFVDQPGTFTATTGGTTSIDLAWTQNAALDDVIITVNTTNTFGAPQNGTSYSAGNAIPGGGTVVYTGSGTSFNHTGLTASTQYYYQIWSANGTNYSGSFLADDATTAFACVSLTPVTLPFTEGFESSNGISNNDAIVYCDGTRRIDFETTVQGVGEVEYGTNALVNNGGSGAAVLSKNGTGTDPENYLIITVNLGNYTSATDLALQYDYFDAWDEVNAPDKVWVRGNNAAAWVQIDDWNDATQGIWETSPLLDIDATLTGAGQTVSSTFQMRFGQLDNSEYLGSSSGDGVVFDNITIVQVIEQPITLTATAVATDQIDLAWTQNLAGNDVVIFANTANTFGTPASGTAYSVGDLLPGGGEVVYVGSALSLNHTTLGASPLTPVTTYYYSAYSYIGTDYSTNNITATATTLANCPDPTSLAVSNVQVTTADLSWTAGGNQIAAEVSYGAPGFVPGNGTQVTGIAGTSTTLTGLTLGTSYEAYVRDQCAAAVNTPLLTENFDGAASVPAGWLSLNGPLHPNRFDYSTASANSAPGHLALTGNVSDDVESWLFTDAFAVTAGETYEIRFNARITGTPNNITAKITTGQNIPAYNSGTTLFTTTATGTYVQYTGQYIAPSSGNVHLSIFSSVDAFVAGDVYIDDVEVVEVGGSFSNWVGPVAFQTFCGPFAGMYTIDQTQPTAGTNYNSFADAIADLTCGVTGAVTFNVLNGPYNEQITLPQVQGVSSTNTVTFNGNGNVLEFTPTSADRHVVQFDGLDYTTFDNFTFRTNATLYGWLIHLYNESEFNTLSNNTFDLTSLTSVSSSNSGAIVLSGSTTSYLTDGNNANNLTISGNTFNGSLADGYNLININGEGGVTGTGADNFVIENNTFNNFYNTALYIDNMNNGVVRGNTFQNPASTDLSTTFEAVFVLGESQGNVFENNVMTNMYGAIPTSTDDFDAFYFSSCDAQASNPNIVRNNLVYNIGGRGTLGGIYMTGSDYLEIYHNTISFDDATSTASGTIEDARAIERSTTAALGNVVQNNILNVTRGGSSEHYGLYYSGVTGLVSDNNLVNVSGGVSAYFGYFGANRATLADFQAAAGTDALSLQDDPSFVAIGSDYNPTAGAANVNNANLLALVPTDINGAARTIFTKGAYEICIPGVWNGSASNDWFNTANWDCGVIPSSTVDATIPSGAANYPLLSGGVTATALDVTIFNGALIDNASIVGVHPTLETYGDWLNQGTFGAAGDVTFMGAVQQTVKGNTDFNVVRIQNAAGVIVDANASVGFATSLELASGNLTATGSVIARSSALGTAFVDDFSPGNAGTVTGTLTQERYVNNGVSGFSYLGAGVGSATLTDWGGEFSIAPFQQFGAPVTDGSPVIPTSDCNPDELRSNSPYGGLFDYDETLPTDCNQSGWRVRFSGAAQPAKGFAGVIPNGTVADISGSYTTGPVTSPTVTNTTSNTASNGFNLISNPYMSPIDWTTVAAANTNIQGFANLWQATGTYQGTYQPINTIVPGYIASGQGFFIQVNTTGTVSFDNSMRVADDANFFRQTKPYESILKMNVAGNGYSDLTYVAFGDDFTTAIDRLYDANKMYSATGLPTVYTKTDVALHQSINALPNDNTVKVVPMGFKPGADGQFTFIAEELNSFAPTALVFLEDLKTGAMQNLREHDTYSFSSVTTDDEMRFKLHFVPAAVITTVDADCDNANGSVSIDLGQYTVNGAAITWDEMLLWDASSSVHINELNASGTHNATLSGGTYILTMNYGGYSINESIIVEAAPSVTAEFVADNNIVNVNDAVSFTATATNTTYYDWDMGDGTIIPAGSDMVTHFYTEAGIYDVTLVASNDVCSATHVGSITVQKATGLTTVNEGSIKVFGYKNVVNVEFNNYTTDDEVDIRVFDLSGKVLLTKRNVRTQDALQFPVQVTEFGYYLISIEGPNTNLITKVGLNNL